MFSILFLIFSTMTGYVLTRAYLDGFCKKNGDKDCEGAPKVMLWLPSSFVVGIVASGTLTYACCMIFATTGYGMLNGCILSLALMAAFLAINRKTLGLTGFSKETPRLKNVGGALHGIKDGAARHAPLCCFFAALTIFLVWFYTYSFFVEDGHIAAGYTVFSDFGPHVAVMRSFSAGNNFPAQYPHFPDGTMRYHFMFHFVAGTLEYLGLRIDIAMNLLSLLTMLSCLSLLYCLAVKLTKKSAAGMLTIVFFLFRSSFAIFTYLFGGAQGGAQGDAPQMGIFEKIVNVPLFIGNTQHEDWGLWSNNVYANQRHLPLGIALLLLAVLAYLPRVKGSAREVFATKNAWVPQGCRQAVFLGLLLGAAAYFHGSGVVAALGILAVMAIFSAGKLEYAITAAIAFALAVFQNIYHGGSEGGVSPELRFGFLVHEPTALRVAGYLVELTGIIFVVAAVGAIALRKKSGLKMAAAFLVPAVLTFTLSLTPDITVNHKYLMISLALLNIYAAYAIIWTVERFARAKIKAVGVAYASILVLMLTASGIVDTFAYRNRNGPDRSARYPDTVSDTVEWIRGNTPTGSVFLSHWHVQSPVFLAGRFEFLGWPYFGMSAGYDTRGRGDAIIEIFKIRDRAELREALRENGISYVFVDRDLLENDEFGADHDTLSRSLTLLFRSEHENIEIYGVE